MAQYGSLANFFGSVTGGYLNDNSPAKVTLLDEGVVVSNNVTTLNFVGTGVTVTGTNDPTATITIGGGASSVVLDNAAAPTYPTAPQTQGVWYGTNTRANVFASNSVCLGNSANCGASLAVAIGANADSNGSQCVALGAGATCTVGQTATAVGYLATAAGTDGTAVGANSNAAVGTTAIGAGATASSTSASAFGANAVANVVGGVALGNLATTNDTAHALGVAVNAASVTSAGLGVTVNGTSAIVPLNFTTQDEGVPLSTAVSTLNFVGSGVVASGAGATTTVTIAGGGAPSGAAGGDLSGTYPNPAVARVDGIAYDYTIPSALLGQQLIINSDSNQIEYTRTNISSTPSVTQEIFRRALAGNFASLLFTADYVSWDQAGTLAVDVGSLYGSSQCLVTAQGGTWVVKVSQNAYLAGDGTMTGATATWAMAGNDIVLTLADASGPTWLTSIRTRCVSCSI